MNGFIVRNPSKNACAVFYTDVDHMDTIGFRTMLSERPELIHVIPPAGYYDIYVGGSDNKGIHMGKLYPINWDAIYSPTENLELVSLNTCKHRFQRHVIRTQHDFSCPTCGVVFFKP